MAKPGIIRHLGTLGFRNIVQQYVDTLGESVDMLGVDAAKNAAAVTAWLSVTKVVYVKENNGWFLVHFYSQFTRESIVSTIDFGVLNLVLLKRHLVIQAWFHPNCQSDLHTILCQVERLSRGQRY
jgi:hypothetical protein